MTEDNDKNEEASLSSMLPISALPLEADSIILHTI